MNKINAIDLDNTLIPFDSFRKYLLMFLLIKKYTIKILYLLFLRIFKLVDKDLFKKKIYLITCNHKDYDQKMKLFSEELSCLINRNIVEKIKENSDDQTINILVTASYKAYSNYIADYLGWECIASEYKEGEFIHVYGEEKIRLLLKIYPIDKYKYNYCISDSNSDLNLLNKFEKSELFNPII